MEGELGRKGTAGLKKVAVWIVVLVAVFLSGYVPSWWEARTARLEAERLEHRLRLSELRGKLGMISYEVTRNNFGSAAQLSTEFFGDLREIIEGGHEEDREQQLRMLAARRDEITSGLAQADPAVRGKIAEMYAEFSRILE